MNKTTQAGFSIFECLLYVGMFVFVITQLFEYVVSTQQRVSRFTTSANASLGWLIAQDILVRDLVTGPAKMDGWITVAQSELLWVCVDGSAYNWYLKNGNIMRIKGTYNMQNKSWTQSTKSTVAENITQFNCFPRYDGNKTMRGMGVAWAGKNDAGNEQAMQLFVTLRNRKML